jgi:heparanase
MSRIRLAGLTVSIAFACIALAAAALVGGHSRGPVSAPVLVAPDTLPRIATIDERFLSYNVEMAEVIGGNFWKPYDAQTLATLRAKAAPGAAAGDATGGTSPQPAGMDPALFQARPPIDLTNGRLRKLAAALGPAYVRVSGTWANSVYFHDAGTPPPDSAPRGFQGVLTRAEWRAVVDFTRAANARLVTSFAISAGVRDSAGVWTPRQAERFVAYTRAAGGDIAGAEMFNEPTMPTYGGSPPGYDAEAYARDYAVFHRWARAAMPRMLIAGPGAVGEGVLIPLIASGAGSAASPMTNALLRTEDLLSATPRPVFDVFSFHFYGAASIRCASMGTAAQTSADSALSEAFLARADTSWAFYGGLRARFEPGKPVWITETADAACGGNPWAATFLDSFRFLDQLGRFAKHGVNAVFHNTLASSEYGLLDQTTFLPRPDYWAALLWRRLMGATVLDAGAPRLGLHLYAHCLRGRPGGVTLLAINNSRAESTSVALPKAAERYTLTAPKLEDSRVELNGRELRLSAGDALPALQGVRVPAGRVALAPASITFLAIQEAGNGACR